MGWSRYAIAGAMLSALYSPLGDANSASHLYSKEGEYNVVITATDSTGAITDKDLR